MRGQRGDRERLLDISEAIETIRTHITSSIQVNEPMAAAAAMHWIEIVGEAANGLSSDIRSAHPDVAWSDAIRMRNRLIHGYFDIDLGLLWQTIDRDLPLLQAQVWRFLETVPE